MSTDNNIGITIKRGQGVTQALKEHVQKSGYEISDGSISKHEWKNTVKVLNEIQASRVASKKNSLFGKNYLVKTGDKLNFTEDEMKRIYDAMGVNPSKRNNGTSGETSPVTVPDKPSQSKPEGKTQNQAQTSSNVSGKEVANLLHDDIYAKTKWGMPTTGKDIGEHIKLINKDNIDEVAAEYQKRNKEPLMEAILSERGLPPEERAQYLKHVSNAMLESAKEKGIYVDDLKKDFNKEIDYQMNRIGVANAGFLNSFTQKLKSRIDAKEEEPDKTVSKPNGKIDEYFSQGKTGDCWLLASIKALAMSEKGLEILNDSIEVDEQGNVNVTLKGVGKTYKITPEELDGALQFATGDGDVRAIEIAMDRYFKDERGVNHWVLWNPNTNRDLAGNTADLAFELLTGKGGRNFISNSLYVRLSDWIITDTQIDNFNLKNHIAVVSSTFNANNLTFTADDGTTQILLTNHAYAVKGSDKDNVYLVNPHDTSEVITVPRDKFKSFFNSVDEYDL